MKSFSRLLWRNYSPYRYHCKRYAKSAKKRRIRKKWRARFGKDLEEIIYAPNPFFEMIERLKIAEAEYQGREYPISISEAQ